MTLPAFRQVASVTFTSRTSPITVSKPTGTLDGDIMLAITAIGKPSANTGEVITEPAGWTAVNAVTNATDSGFTIGFRVWWKRASSEGSTYDFTHNAGVARSNQIAILSYSGCQSSGSPIDTYTVNSGVGTVATALSVTTSVNDVMLAICGHNWDIAGATSVSSGTERFDNLCTECELGRPTAGATGNLTYIPGSNTGYPWQTWMIGLKPVGAGTSVSVSATGETMATTAGTVGVSTGGAPAAPSDSVRQGGMVSMAKFMGN